MEYPNRRHPRCTVTHLGLNNCRECMGLYDRDAPGQAPEKAVRVRRDKLGSRPELERDDAATPEHARQPEARQADAEICVDAPGGGGLVSCGKPDRLGVALKSPVGEVMLPEFDAPMRPLSRAEISRRQREKDPEAYRAWNKARMAKIRGSPKPEC